MFSPASPSVSYSPRQQTLGPKVAPALTHQDGSPSQTMGLRVSCENPGRGPIRMSLLQSP